MLNIRNTRIHTVQTYGLIIIIVIIRINDYNIRINYYSSRELKIRFKLRRIL